MAETGVTRPLAIIIFLVGVVLGQNDSPVLTNDLKDNRKYDIIQVLKKLKTNTDMSKKAKARLRDSKKNIYPKSRPYNRKLFLYES